jgi:hypothetical protein
MEKQAEEQPVQTEKCGGNNNDCKGEAQAPHTCPYLSEINDDEETLCTCCKYCEQECADAI